MKLNARQIQVLLLVAEDGCSDKEIAHQLGITIDYVKMLTGQLRKAYGVNNRAKIIIRYWKEKRGEIAA